MSELLTEKEIEAAKSLKFGFNRVRESSDINIVASRRVEISRVWSNKMLFLSFVFNVIAISCFVFSALLLALKPEPKFYASTPNGKIYGPLKKIEHKVIKDSGIGNAKELVGNNK